MRPLILVAVLSASLLQGCTVVSVGVVLEGNRYRRAESRTSGPDTATRPPAPGDTLSLRLADGRTVRSAFVSLSQDSLALDAGTFALGDVDRVERPWKRFRMGTLVPLGILADVAVVWTVLSNVRLNGLDIRL